MLILVCLHPSSPPIVSPGALGLYVMRNSEQLLPCHILNAFMLLDASVVSHFSYIPLKLRNPRLSELPSY